MAVTVRYATDSDAEKIAAVYTTSFRRAYRQTFPDDYLDSDTFIAENRKLWTEHFGSSATDYPVCVADDNGAVIGFCSFGPSRDDDEAGAELYNVYVDPMHWSMGVGSTLQRSAKEWMKANGHTESYLWVAEDN